MVKKHGRSKHMRGRKRGHRFRYYKSKVGKAEVMVNRTPARLHNVVAPHYLTRLQYGFTGGLSLGAGVQSYFNVWMNSPFTPGVSVSGVPPYAANFLAFTSGGAGGTLYPATHALNALNPVGYSALQGLYERYRVFASKIDVTLCPTSSSNVMLNVCPINGDALGLPDPGNDVQKAQSCPYSKFITCSENNNMVQNRISLYMDCPTIIGYTKQQYKDDPNTSSEAAQLLNNYAATFWQVNYSPFGVSGAVNATVEVRVTYWLEFFEPYPPADT